MPIHHSPVLDPAGLCRWLNLEDERCPLAVEEATVCPHRFRERIAHGAGQPQGGDYLSVLWFHRYDGEPDALILAPLFIPDEVSVICRSCRIELYTLQSEAQSGHGVPLLTSQLRKGLKEAATRVDAVQKLT